MPTLWIRSSVLAVLVTAVLVIACGSPKASDRNSQLQQVVDLAATGGVIEIEELVELTPRPCVRLEPDAVLPAGVPNLDCPVGEPEGTLVDAFWSSACEGSWWSLAGHDAAIGIAFRIAEMNLNLYAVYVSRQVASEYWVASDHYALFEEDHDGVIRGYGLYLREGRIVGTDGDCGLPPTEMAELNRLGIPVFSAGNQ